MKMKMYGGALAALTLLASTFSSQAADIPRPVYKGAVRPIVAYYNWTGLYAGINGGYAFGDAGVGTGSPSPSGYLIGGTVGYNYQVGSIVYGLEGDFDYASVKDTVACGAFTCTAEQKWLATFRGRVGYAFDRWLPYLTGGGAYSNVRASINPGVASASDTKLGYTLGAGLEYAFMSNWTAKIEYLYVDLGRINTAVGTSGDITENVVRAGLNYKFSGPIFSNF